MKKSFLFVFEVLFLSMVFISCSEFFISSLKETSNGLQNEGETQTAGLQTVKITLSLPSALASNDSLSERTVTASSLTLNYKVLATASGQNHVTADSNSNNANLELTLKEGCTWTITVKAYTDTDTNYANVILQGATTVNVVGGLGVTIPLCIYTDTDASTGKIFLALAADKNSFTKYSYKFTNHDDNSFYSGTSSTATNGVLAPKDFLPLSSNEKISINNVKSGTYRLTIWFYDDNGYLVYVLSTGVNVYPTLTTNTWSGEKGASDSTFTLSTAMVASQKSLTLYVCGSDDSNNSKISFYGTSSGILSGKYQTPSDSNSGGAYSPLATVAAAVKKCTVSNNTYTIFVDGTTYENSYINVDTCNINISSLGTDKATIKRNFTKADSVINVTESNTLNMTNIIVDGNKDASGYYFPNNGGGIKNTGTVSLNNCTIQNCKATYGNGIYQGGSLNIGGDTYIESSSDIFLNDKTLNVTSNLTYNAPFVATITPNNYNLATITVGSNLALAEVTKKIAITTPSNTSGQTYCVGSDGKPTTNVREEIFATAFANAVSYSITNHSAEVILTIAPETISVSEPVTISGTAKINVTGTKGSSIITANDNGNKIFSVTDTATLTLNNVTLQNAGTKSYYSSDKGGAINGASGTKITVGNGCTIQNCKGYNGGGIYTNGTLTVEDGATITNNEAQTGGGGVSVSEGIFTMTGGTISNNTAFTSGGGIALFKCGTTEDSRVSIGGSSVISGNICKGGTSYGGGGISVYQTWLNLGSEVIIKDNYSAYNGGGIYFRNNGNEYNLMFNGTITNNFAKYGGGVCMAGGVFNMGIGKIEFNGVLTNSKDVTGGTGGGVYLGLYLPNIPGAFTGDSANTSTSIIRNNYYNATWDVDTKTLTHNSSDQNDVGVVQIGEAHNNNVATTAGSYNKGSESVGVKTP